MPSKIPSCAPETMFTLLVIVNIQVIYGGGVEERAGGGLEPS